MDEVDERILSVLQDDARNNTNAAISDRVAVSQSTVGKRIKKLEETGAIKGYYPEIDYNVTGHPHWVLFVCTSSITERDTLIDRALELPGVVGIKELMTGDRNILIEVVGRDHEDITHLAAAIDELGIRINDEVLVKEGHHRPASVFDG